MNGASNWLERVMTIRIDLQSWFYEGAFGLVGRIMGWATSRNCTLTLGAGILRTTATSLDVHLGQVDPRLRDVWVGLVVPTIGIHCHPPVSRIPLGEGSA